MNAATTTFAPQAGVLISTISRTNNIGSCPHLQYIANTLVMVSDDLVTDVRTFRASNKDHVPSGTK